MKRWLILCFSLGLLLILAAPGGANSIHVRSFESADVIFSEQQLQLFSVAALQGEKLTLVVYGLDEGVQPYISLFDVNGVTIGEDLNSDGDQIAVLEVTIPENGLYTFVVSRLSENGGLMRVMVFEGEPLQGDLSLLDTIDPLLPSRAYFVEGAEAAPVIMTLSVLDDENEDTPTPQVYASRGTEVSLPPTEERLQAVDQVSWENEAGDIFYTLNVRALPEILPTSSKLGGQLRQAAQFLDLTNIRLDIGAGGVLEALSRPVCNARARNGAVGRLGPGDQYREVTRFNANQALELVGESGDFYLVVDANSPTGGSWVEKSSVNSESDLAGLACSRVEPFAAPDLTDENSIQQQPSGGGGSGTGGNNPLGGLPPLGGGNPDGPGEGDPGITVFIPPPGGGEPNSEAGGPKPSLSIDCVFTGSIWEVKLIWSNLQLGDNIAWSGGVDFGPAAGAQPAASSSGFALIGGSGAGNTPQALFSLNGSPYGTLSDTCV
jgi:hypothetical protein